MNILKLYEKTISKEDISDYLKNNKDTYFFIGPGDESLFEYIDKLGMANKDDFYFKVLKEIDFDFNVCLKNQDGSIIKQNYARLSHLFQDIDLSIIHTYKIVLDTEEKKYLSEVIQQFIHAGIIVDLTLKSEEDRRRIVDSFSRNSGKIIKETDDLVKKIKGINPPAKGLLSQEIKKTILDTLSQLPPIIESTQNKPIKVALLGPRRNGKSEIANCILGESYVPTTADLITPTNCIYEKSPDGKLRVILETVKRRDSIAMTAEKVKDKVVEFATVDELRGYLYELFKNNKVQLDPSSGYSIPEITVHYNPTKDAALSNVVLIDTPGPNIAGTDEHKKMAYRWLKDADVVLFVIEYQYARNAENVKFIEDVQNEIFREKGKNYSLIFVGNKSDIRFNAGEKPSLIRIIDRFKTELNNLGLDAFVSVATSALTYNGITKIVRDYTSDGKHIAQDSTEDFENLRDFHKKKYGGGKNDYMLSAGMIIRNQADGLELYYQQQPSITLLKEISGINTLMKFTRYVAEEKALFEIIDLAIRRIQMMLINIENDLLAKNILGFKGNKKKVIEILEEYKRYVQFIKETELPSVKLDSLDGVIDEVLDDFEEDLREHMTMRFIQTIREIDGSSASTKEQLIDQIINEYTRQASKVVNSDYKDSFYAMNTQLVSKVKTKKNVFTDIHEKIKEKFNEVKIKLNSESLKIDDFKFPDAPPFRAPDISFNIDTDASLRIYLQSNIVDKSKGGILHSIFRWVDNTFFDGREILQGLLEDLVGSIFGEELGKKLLRQGNDWSVYSDDIKKSELGLVFSNQAKSLNRDVARLSKDRLKNWQLDTNREMNGAIRFIESQVEKLIGFITQEHDDIAEQIKFLEVIQQEFNKFQRMPETDFIFNLDKNISYASEPV